MQMSDVFIVQFGSDDELDASTDALRKKSAIPTLCGGCTGLHWQPGTVSGSIVLADAAQPSASGWKEYFNADDKIKQFMNRVSEAKDNVGLYIVAHGYCTGIGINGVIKGDQLAAAVIALGFTSLDKVNLSACNMAGRSATDHDRTFVSNFAAKLADEGMRPLIACYVGWNSPATNVRGFTNPPSVAPKDQTKAAALKKSVVNEGGTLVKNPGNTPLQFVEDRNQFKKAFQMDDSGTLSPRTLEQWHSK